MAFDSVPNDPFLIERFDSLDDSGESLELIHCFDSVEDELLYQSQVMNGLYRNLQQDYCRVLDTVSAMQG